jgi:hypothetical protein
VSRPGDPIPDWRLRRRLSIIVTSPSPWADADWLRIAWSRRASRKSVPQHLPGRIVWSTGEQSGRQDIGARLTHVQPGDRVLVLGGSGAMRAHQLSSVRQALRRDQGGGGIDASRLVQVLDQRIGGTWKDAIMRTKCSTSLLIW